MARPIENDVGFLGVSALRTESSGVSEKARQNWRGFDLPHLVVPA